MIAPAARDVDLPGAVAALEQALHEHEEWSEVVHGTLICRTKVDENDLGIDAHHRCRFGRWYEADGAKVFEDHPGFKRISGEHEHMHRLAAGLLRDARDGKPIAVDAYRHFTRAMHRLRISIGNLRQELVDALYNLDPLTGTPGRASMPARLREEQSLVDRSGRSCVVAMLDLDHFKRVNDQYGHRAGDHVLASFARYVMESLRPYDKVFRYGGEEFLVCLPEAGMESGRDILERIRVGVASQQFDVGEGRAIGITVSIGFAAIERGGTAERSIEHADRALYAAKKAGRNRTVAWTALEATSEL